MIILDVSECCINTIVNPVQFSQARRAEHEMRPGIPHSHRLSPPKGLRPQSDGLSNKKKKKNSPKCAFVRFAYSRKSTTEEHTRGRGHSSHARKLEDRPQPSSTPPTRTAILSGNGETSELVIGGTAARPCSDDVCMSIVRRLFESVAARVLSNCWRSARATKKRLSQPGKGRTEAC